MRNAYIVLPHGCSQDLLDLIKIKDLDESDSEVHHNTGRGILHRSRKGCHARVAVQETIDETRFVREEPECCVVGAFRVIGAATEERKSYLKPRKPSIKIFGSSCCQITPTF